jgi:hypothetical protein
VILVCGFCARQGLPSFMAEVEPYADLRVIDGICSPLHVEEVQARLKALVAEIRAGEGEPS